MDPPPVQYVTTTDGFRIAYAVSGSGTPVFFLPGTAFSHVLLAWEYPRLRDWLQGLSQRFQLIQMDPRGFGMSSREVRENLTRQDYQKDVDAVVSRLKLGRFIVVAASSGDDVAVDYSLQHPEHVIALVLGTWAVRWSTAMFTLLPDQDWDSFLYSVTPRDRSREERERIVALRRQAYDQQNYLLQSRVMMYGQPDAYATKTESLLQELRVPTLVLHSRDHALFPVEQGMKRAQLSGGRLVLIDGTDSWGMQARASGR
jgi:pimeloyl-ACP methyl ester carboxylesterase